jgi:hypothetical protein
MLIAQKLGTTIQGIDWRRIEFGYYRKVGEVWLRRGSGEGGGQT